MRDPAVPSRAVRAGRLIRQPAGYTAFVPTALPPDPSIDLGRLVPLLSSADQAIGRLDGVGLTLPNPDLFVAMYVRREAVLSSQIEGTQSTLDDVLAYELDANRRQLPGDVGDVVHHLANVPRQLSSIGVELVGQHVVQRALRPFDLGAEDGLPPDVHRHEQIWIRKGEADSVESTDCLVGRREQRHKSAEIDRRVRWQCRRYERRVAGWLANQASSANGAGRHGGVTHDALFKHMTRCFDKGDLERTLRNWALP